MNVIRVLKELTVKRILMNVNVTIPVEPMAPALIKSMIMNVIVMPCMVVKIVQCL